MKFFEYLKDKIVSIFVYLVTVIIIFILLDVFNTHKILVIFIPVILIILGLFIILREYYKKRHFYNDLESNLNILDKKYLWTEIIKCPDFIEGKILYETLYQIDKSMIENINKYKYTSDEFMEYLEMWCHEIKTPIATTNLIIDNNKNKITDNILEEIDKINIFVESDSKWLEFIINQIVTNSIKYRKDNDSIIKFTIDNNKNNVVLKIKDNGIGIKSDEINRVFDKGWTGSLGRNYTNSTGIGLYLCKKLCEKLNHNIFITSNYGIETTVYIVFPISSMIKN